jgi:GcrA cell cycle regulator
MSWNAERITAVETLWRGGLSAAQIAAALGAGITRNAVIGKLHRLGLSGRKKTAAAERPSPVRSGGAMKALGRGRHAIAKPQVAPRALCRPSPSPKLGTLPREGRPDHPLVSLVDLGRFACHYPFGTPGDDNFGFCGAKVDPQTARYPFCYCDTHRAIAYQTGSAHAPSFSAKCEEKSPRLDDLVDEMSGDA